MLTHFNAVKQYIEEFYTPKLGTDSMMIHWQKLTSDKDYEHYKLWTEEKGLYPFTENVYKSIERCMFTPSFSLVFTVAPRGVAKRIYNYRDSLKIAVGTGTAECRFTHGEGQYHLVEHDKGLLLGYKGATDNSQAWGMYTHEEYLEFLEENQSIKQRLEFLNRQ